MNYFAQLVKESKKLDKLAEPYLANRPNWSLNDIAAENYKLGMKYFEDKNEDWNAVPEVVALIADYYVPFSTLPRNGSLKFALGFSIASMEAHAWHLYDFLSGKNKEYIELPFNVVADVK